MIPAYPLPPFSGIMPNRRNHSVISEPPLPVNDLRQGLKCTPPNGSSANSCRRLDQPNLDPQTRRCRQCFHNDPCSPFLPHQRIETCALAIVSWCPRPATSTAISTR